MRTEIGTRPDPSTKKQIGQSNSYTVTSEFAQHCKRLEPKFKISPWYEFVEWAQAADPTNTEVLYKGFAWDTTDGEDRNEYKYEALSGALIITSTEYTLNQMLNGKVTHIVTWKTTNEWNNKLRTYDIKEGDVIPYTITGKTPSIVVLKYLKENDAVRYVLS